MFIADPENEISRASKATSGVQTTRRDTMTATPLP
jgi:hypothetical protein